MSGVLVEPLMPQNNNSRDLDELQKNLAKLRLEMEGARATTQHTSSSQSWSGFCVILIFV